MFQVYYKYPTVRDLIAEGTKAQDLEGNLHSAHLCKAPTMGILLVLTLGFRPTPSCLQTDGIAIMLRLWTAAMPTVGSTAQPSSCLLLWTRQRSRRAASCSHLSLAFWRTLGHHFLCPRGSHVSHPLSTSGRLLSLCLSPKLTHCHPHSVPDHTSCALDTLQVMWPCESFFAQRECWA